MRNESREDEAIDLEDVRLVREMTAGKASALGEFYDKWSGRVFSVAVAIVGEHADAEEVVEETFLQAWKQASRFDSGRGRVASWILNIARSRALDRLKAVKRRREDPIETEDVARASDEADPAQQLLATEQSEAIRAALFTLPLAQRQAVEMAYFGGLSQSEISESTGLALGTVKTRMRLAMQKLREQLAPAYGGHV
ncbi:MAG: sigma-70 family RNA polymerase sigma factor [Gemmatimonadota bacterium]|nr:sigma-70 family RNA polymerase sigma factor [Gemmatimonadota bacterium]